MEDKRKEKIEGLIPTSGLDQLWDWFKEFKYDEDKVQIQEEIDYFKEVNDYLEKKNFPVITNYNDVLRLIRNGVNIYFNLDDYLKDNIRIIKKPDCIQLNQVRYETQDFWEELDFRKQLLCKALDMLCLIDEDTDEFGSMD